MALPEIEPLVRKAVLLYNRLKNPEVIVKPILITSASVTVSFSGGFCYSCGVMDYVDGFARQFKLLNDRMELKLVKTRETNPRVFEADYIIKNK